MSLLKIYRGRRMILLIRLFSKSKDVLGMSAISLEEGVAIRRKRRLARNLLRKRRGKEKKIERGSQGRKMNLKGEEFMKRIEKMRGH